VGARYRRVRGPGGARIIAGKSALQDSCPEHGLMKLNSSGKFTGAVGREKLYPVFTLVQPSSMCASKCITSQRKLARNWIVTFPSETGRVDVGGDVEISLESGDAKRLDDCPEVCSGWALGCESSEPLKLFLDALRQFRAQRDAPAAGSLGRLLQLVPLLFTRECPFQPHRIPAASWANPTPLAERMVRPNHYGRMTDP